MIEDFSLGRQKTMGAIQWGEKNANWELAFYKNMWKGWREMAQLVEPLQPTCEDLVQGHSSPHRGEEGKWHRGMLMRWRTTGAHLCTSTAKCTH